MTQTQAKADHWDLLMDGVYLDVLKEIFEVHQHDPERVLYMQPHRKSRITKLRDDPPTPENPVKMWITTGDDRNRVTYSTEIIGWDDKTKLDDHRKEQISSVIAGNQPGEQRMLEVPEKWGVNLLHVRRMKRLADPFHVSRLIVISTNKPIPSERYSPRHFYVRLQTSTVIPA